MNPVGSITGRLGSQGPLADGVTICPPGQSPAVNAEPSAFLDPNTLTQRSEPVYVEVTQGLAGSPPAAIHALYPAVP
ncbi:hypothetical protein D3C83_114080 [compost metagenome]